MLSECEREDWEICQCKRDEFIKGWNGNSQGADMANRSLGHSPSQADCVDVLFKNKQ
jgi:hypothetical protein